MLETTPPLEGKEISAAAALTKTKQKIKTYAKIFFGGDVTFCMYPLSPMSLFITDFGYPSHLHPLPPPPYLRDVIFEWLRSDLY